MSPLSKSKSAKSSKHSQSKDKSQAATSSAYNPLSGTFHSLESTDLVLNPIKFRHTDTTEPSDQFPTSPNCDSASNNDSCSGESEEAHKDKEKSTNATSAALSAQESDKREKIRQKNEKKHQRQRERRAQELHEKCSGYLMSRKLESLSGQLVAMGFTQEQATMALIQNEGKVEESVAWLFEGGEESRQPESSALDLNCGVGLKIDITDELARIAEFEVKYNSTKQEVERAVVNCEGDLVKTEEALKNQKQEASRPKTPPVPPLKIEEPVQVQTVSTNQRPPLGAKVVGLSTNLPTVPPHQRPALGTKGERDLNYAMKSQVVQTTDRPVNPLNQKQPPQLVLEKRWQPGTQNPNLYPSSSSAVPVQQMKSENHYPVPTSLLKGNLNSAVSGVTGQINPLREPSVVMQRPQQTLINPNSTNNISKQNIPSTSLGLGHQTNRALALQLSHEVQNLQNLGIGRNNSSANGSMTAGSQHYGQQNHVEVPMNSSWVNGSSLASPSSLGLFTGWGSLNRSPNNDTAYNNNYTDWSNGGYSHNQSHPCDYTSIDWSLDLTLLNTGSGTSTGLSDTWSTMFMGRSGTSIGSGVRKGGGTSGNNEGRLNDWTSPFSGDDILGASRRLVMPPSCSRGGRGEGILE